MTIQRVAQASHTFPENGRLSTNRYCGPPIQSILTQEDEDKGIRLCGRLVYLVNVKTGVGDIGLLACGKAKPYVFRRHPRDLIPFYQFRNAKIGSGDEFCDVKYGCIDRYINGFENYIGISNCKECGTTYPPVYTWTHAPLYSYTPTPVTPSPTPTLTFTPAPTSTPAATRTPVSVLELLVAETSTPSPSPTASRATIPSLPTVQPPQGGFDPSSVPIGLYVGGFLVLLAVAILVFEWLRTRR